MKIPQNPGCADNGRAGPWTLWKKSSITMMPPGTTKSQTFFKASWEGNQLEDVILPIKTGAIQPTHPKNTLWKTRHQDRVIQIPINMHKSQPQIKTDIPVEITLWASWKNLEEIRVWTRNIHQKPQLVHFIPALSQNSAKANAIILLGKSMFPHHQLFCSCATHWNLNPRRSRQRSCFLESQNVTNRGMRGRVWCDNKRGCDSSELHILYLSNFLIRNYGAHSKIAHQKKKETAMIKDRSGKWHVHYVWFIGKVWKVHSQIKSPLTLMVINAAPSVSQKVFLLEFSTKCTSRQYVTIFHSISCIFAGISTHLCC